MKRLEAVAFDIDGTLTEDNSWFNFTNELGGSEAEHITVYEALGLGTMELSEAKEQLVAMWAKQGKAYKHTITDIYEKLPLRTDAYPLFDWIISKEIPVCLITGATKQYAASVAAKLGIEEYYASSELIFDDQDKLIDFDYEVDQTKAKELHFAEFCARHSVSVENCVPIGDSYNDMGLFRVTGNGLLLDAEGNAKQELKDASFKIVKSSFEAQELLQSFHI